MSQTQGQCREKDNRRPIKRDVQPPTAGMIAARFLRIYAARLLIIGGICTCTLFGHEELQIQK